MDPKKILPSAGVAVALGLIFMTMMLGPRSMFIVSILALVALFIIYPLAKRNKR